LVVPVFPLSFDDWLNVCDSIHWHMTFNQWINSCYPYYLQRWKGARWHVVCMAWIILCWQSCVFLVLGGVLLMIIEMMYMC